MDMTTVQMVIPSGMAPYLSDEDSKATFARNAMVLYPLIQDMTISHGKAAEILGVHKTDLIEFYGSMGIPYLNQSKEELEKDISTLEALLGVKK